jgi:hypothetical protein
MALPSLLLFDSLLLFPPPVSYVFLFLLDRTGRDRMGQDGDLKKSLTQGEFFIGCPLSIKLMTMTSIRFFDLKIPLLPR